MFGKVWEKTCCRLAVILNKPEPSAAKNWPSAFGVVEPRNTLENYRIASVTLTNSATTTPL